MYWASARWGTLIGIAEVQSQFKGHKQVTIADTTYTAVEFEYNYAFTAEGILTVDDIDVPMTIHVSRKVSTLAVPEVGVIQEKSTTRGSTSGRSSQGVDLRSKGRGKLTLELVDVT